MSTSSTNYTNLSEIPEVPSTSISVQDHCPVLSSQSGSYCSLHVCDVCYKQFLVEAVLCFQVPCPAVGPLVASISQYRSQEDGGSYIQLTFTNARGSGSLSNVQLRTTNPGAEVHRWYQSAFLYKIFQDFMGNISTNLNYSFDYTSQTICPL